MNRYDDEETRPTLAEWQRIERHSARLDVLCWYLAAAIAGMTFWVALVLFVRWLAGLHV